MLLLTDLLLLLYLVNKFTNTNNKTVSAISKKKKHTLKNNYNRTLIITNLLLYEHHECNFVAKMRYSFTLVKQIIDQMRNKCVWKKKIKK